MAKIKRTGQYWQHGDVVLHEVTAIPKAAQRVDARPLAVGEVTGHAHRFLGENVEYYEYEGTLFLRVLPGGETITHEEHGPGRLPETLIEVGGVQEYDHFVEEARRVVD